MPIQNLYAPLIGRPRPGRLATLGDFLTGFDEAREKRAERKDRDEARAIQKQDRELRQQEIDLRNQTIQATQRKLQTDEEKIAATKQLIQQHTTPEGVDFEGVLEGLYAIDPDAAMELDKHLDERAKAKRDGEKAELDARRAQLELDGKDRDSYLERFAAAKTPDQWAEIWDDASQNKMLRVLKGTGLTGTFSPDGPAMAADLVRGVKGRDALTAKDNPTAANAPFTLGPGSKRFGPDGTVIAEVPPSTTQTGAGFTLAPGATRYDAEGKPVASAPQRPPQSAAARPVTSGDAGRIADYDTSLNDLDVLTTTLAGNRATGTSAKVGAMLPNAVTDLTGWGTDAKQKQAVIDRVKQVIGKALEGGVLRKEDEYKYEKILPTIADTAAVVASKLAGLKQSISQRRGTLIDSLEDAGFDTSRYRARKEGAAAADPLGIR